MHYSIATLLVATVLCAGAFALSRFDSLLIPLVFPFTIGPIVAYRVARTNAAFVIGILSSGFWSLVAIIPFVIVGWPLAWSVSAIDERFFTREILVSKVLMYFLFAAIFGGYIGGIVARPE
jgi:hypothetical protein